MSYIVMVVNATEKNSGQFLSLVQQLDTTPTLLLINDTDTVAKAWAGAQIPPVPLMITTPEFELEGRSATYKDTAERISQADAVILMWDGKTKRGQDVLNKATKAQIEIYRN